MFPELGLWSAIKDGDPRGEALARRHYSARRYRDNRRERLFAGPGEKLILLSHDNQALFIWRHFTSRDGQQGVCCSLFRNEGATLSSRLIVEAEALAWQRWPTTRLYTYINPRRIASPNPGYCFLCAGWRRYGYSEHGLHILEKQPPEEET